MIVYVTNERQSVCQLLSSPVSESSSAVGLPRGSVGRPPPVSAQQACQRYPFVTREARRVFYESSGLTRRAAALHRSPPKRGDAKIVGRWQPRFAVHLDAIS